MNGVCLSCFESRKGDEVPRKQDVPGLERSWSVSYEGQVIDKGMGSNGGKKEIEKQYATDEPLRNKKG